MLPALAIAVCTGEWSAALGFGVTMAVMLALGVPVSRIKPRRTDIFARDGLLTAGFSWIVVSLLGALPFLLSGAIPNYVNCVFETVSGFTTTAPPS
jgi:trk system potassium uptake protein TrkH